MRWQMNRGLLVAGLLTAAPLTMVGAQTPAWTSSVDAILGRAGAMQPGGLYKFSLPRSDLTVTVGQVQLKPALALGSWIGFLPVGTTDALVMGDLVLTEGEIGPVMAALQQGGVEQTALHNHLRGEVPHLMYMHIMGNGKPEAIARAIHAALALTGTPAAAGVPAAASAAELDTAAIARTLGRTEKAKWYHLSGDDTARGGRSNGWPRNPAVDGRGDRDQLPVDGCRTRDRDW